MLETFPSQALFGRILIGFSAVLLLVFNGRTAGISGISYNLLYNPLSGTERNWHLCFMAGLVGGAYFFLPVEFELRQGYSPVLPIASGLAVSIGTRISNDCTSGQGVCGIRMLSVCSITTTVAFMISGILTVTILHNLNG